MNTQDLISIIIPVYNAESFLEKCIESILCQTYHNYEIILIDDGSQDNSWSIIRNYMNCRKNIIGHRKKNEGANSARKKGIELAQGRFSMFVDADDYIDKHICEKLIRYTKDQKIDIVLSGIAKIFNGEKVDIVGKWPKGIYSGIYIAENIIDLHQFYIANIGLNLVGKLFKTSIIKNILQTMDIRIGYSEDYACLLLSLLDSQNVFFLDEYLYFYRQHTNSVTHLHTKSNCISTQYLYNYLIPELQKRNSSPAIYKQLEWIIILTLLSGGYDAFKSKKYLYPFKNVLHKSSIVIYGAGTFGGELFNFVSQSHLYKLVLWIDQNWIIYQREGLPVSPPKNIFNVHFDYIVIAVFKTNLINEIRTDLINSGIPAEKIIAIDQNLISYKELPADFF